MNGSGPIPIITQREIDAWFAWARALITNTQQLGS